MGKKTKKEKGLFQYKAKATDPDVRVADFSYQNDALAEMIVTAWNNSTFARSLTDHTNPGFAQAELAKRGIYLAHPVVLTEADYYDGWQMDHADEVVFVLPNEDRVTTGQPLLLETAKLLMACTPNGI